MRVHHLLTHTSGLTYGFQYTHPVDAIYRDKGYDFIFKPGADLDQAVARLVLEPAGLSARVAVELLGRLRRARSTHRDLEWPVARRRSSRSGSSIPGHERHRVVVPAGEGGPTGHALRTRGWRVVPLRRAGRSTRCASHECSAVAADCSRPPTTTTASPPCCSRGGELDGRASALQPNGGTHDVQSPARRRRFRGVRASTRSPRASTRAWASDSACRC